jgi:hypothetical protein
MCSGRLLQPKKNLSGGLFDRREIYVTVWWFADVSKDGVR